MLIALPALIDPHVHFRTPGQEYKEDWRSGALAAFRGGISTVFDMPNNIPPCVTLQRIQEKKKLIDSQLQLPLRYALYLGADREHLDEIEQAKSEVIGIKVFMASSTGTLLIDDDEVLDEVFKKAAQQGLVVAVHAEDEETLRLHRRETRDVADHSKMRPNLAAAIAVERAIEKAKKYRTRLYILHMSTKEEVVLVERAKKEGVDLFAEVTPHHLFLSEEDYPRWKTLVQMNPPLRSKADQEALWDGIARGVIDTIGTDHAPHTFEEKRLPFGQAPSGIPGVETLLPLMLDAVNKGWLTLDRLSALTYYNICKIFRLPFHDDVVWVDMDLEKEVSVQNLQSKCQWTPYEGRRLKGWPRFMRVQNRLFNLEKIEEISQSEELELPLCNFLNRSLNADTLCAPFPK